MSCPFGSVYRVERFVGERDQELRVPTPERFCLAGFLQLLSGVLADRLEHEETAVLAPTEEALVEERFERVEISVEDPDSGLECPGPCEDGKAVEERSLFFLE